MKSETLSGFLLSSPSPLPSFSALPKMRELVKGLDFEITWVTALPGGSQTSYFTLLDLSFLIHDMGQLMTYLSGLMEGHTE